MARIRAQAIFDFKQLLLHGHNSALINELSAGVLVKKVSILPVSFPLPRVYNVIYPLPLPACSQSMDAHFACLWPTK